MAVVSVTVLLAMNAMMLIHYFPHSPTDSGCDNCNEWFHGHCINITEKSAKAIREWYCMRCRGEEDKSSFVTFKTAVLNMKNIAKEIFLINMTLFIFLFVTR